MEKLAKFRVTIFMLLVLSIQSCSSEKSLNLTDTNHGNYLLGNWEGNQQIKIRYQEGFGQYTFIHSKESLPTHLSINNKGEVKGKIGEANIQNARVISNRGALLRTLGWASDFAIKGELQGSIFSQDTLSFRTFSIPLKCDSLTLSGDLFQTEGLDMFPMGTLNLKHKE
jgi:hypothetical protein